MCLFINLQLIEQETYLQLLQPVVMVLWPGSKPPSYHCCDVVIVPVCVCKCMCVCMCHSITTVCLLC